MYHCHIPSLLFIIFPVWSFWYTDARRPPSKPPAVAPTSLDHPHRRYCFCAMLLIKFPPITIIWDISVCSSNLYILYKHVVHKYASSIPYVTIPLFYVLPKSSCIIISYSFVGLMLLTVLWIGCRATWRGWFLRARRRGT
jgi:hypothetical protein